MNAAAAAVLVLLPLTPPAAAGLSIASDASP